MNDTIETISGGTVIQHGKENDRVYLMSLKGDVKPILERIEKLASENGYSKIFCKIPKRTAPVFFAHGFLLEAYIPKFYNDKEDVFFVSKFLSPDRLLNIETEQLLSLSKLIQSRPVAKHIEKTYTARRLEKADAEQMSQIYRDVFATYPFPIHEPAYIRQTMDENIQYYGAEIDGTLAALSSAEMDVAGGNAEMTDFATKAGHHGNSLSSFLLNAMEEDMKMQGITCLYTIARLNSIPMNKTFLRFGYEYSGTLMKNTNIAGKIESMNVYYKHI